MIPAPASPTVPPPHGARPPPYTWRDPAPASFVAVAPSAWRADGWAVAASPRVVTLDPSRGLNAPVLPLHHLQGVTPSLCAPSGATPAATWTSGPGAEYAAIFAGAALGSYVGYIGPRAVCEPIGFAISLATGVVGLTQKRVAPGPARFGTYLVGLLAGAALAFAYKLRTVD